jgi:hypothetical protein
MAQGEAPLVQAVRWIEDRLRDDPHVNRLRLVEEASKQFDLTPLDEEFLIRHVAAHSKPA